MRANKKVVPAFRPLPVFFWKKERGEQRPGGPKGFICSAILSLPFVVFVSRIAPPNGRKTKGTNFENRTKRANKKAVPVFRPFPVFFRKKERGEQRPGGPKGFLCSALLSLPFVVFVFRIAPPNGRKQKEQILKTGQRGRTKRPFRHSDCFPFSSGKRKEEKSGR